MKKVVCLLLALVMLLGLVACASNTAPATEKTESTTTEETKTEEKPLTEQQAATLISHLAGEGFIKTDTPVQEAAPKLPKELEAAKQKAVEVIAREGDITPAAVTQLTAQKLLLSKVP